MSAGGPVADGAPREIEVLVADDSPTNVFVLTAMLKSMGLKTITASDGRAAVEMATEGRPAMVFMDVQMPGLDGITAARRIRKAVPDGGMAIVAVTAFPDVRQHADFREAGFDDVIVKPVELPLVRRVVEKWMAGLPKPGVGAGLA